MSGGKGSTSQSTVSIPPEVLARYNSVNANAQQVAQTPFQTYSGQFVAPLTGTQQAGIANTNAAANEAQPYYQGATAYTLAGGNAVNPTALDSNAINQYMSPYLHDVLGSEAALLNQNNQQQQAGQLGTAISSGAFGGDRAGIAAANLAQQQQLANANIYSGILNQGYNTALATAQQQQGVNLAAQQANREALQQTGQSLAGLGTGAQNAALQGAQAQLAAGQVEQGTQQAQDTALYNQFLQQQSYPFQTAQFLANIAEGTGSLSGSTTTTNTSQNGIFSDERLKDGARVVGKTFDGQPIYTYRYKGDDKTHMGLMAGNVERQHPDAVGLASGYKTVDYEKATDDAADRGHFAYGGVPYSSMGFDPNASYDAMYGDLLKQRSGIVPQANLPVGQLAVAHPGDIQQGQGALGAANNLIDTGMKATKLYDQFQKPKTPAGGLGAPAGAPAPAFNADTDLMGNLVAKPQGLIPGQNDDLYADGGAVPDMLDIPNDPNQHQLAVAQPPANNGGGGGFLDDILGIATKFIPKQDGGRIQRASGGEAEALTPKALRSMLDNAYQSEQASVGNMESGLGTQLGDLSGEDSDDSSPSDNYTSPSAASAPVGLGAGKGTKADRNNNPGNIEAGSFTEHMPGFVGSDGRFAVFDTPEHGRDAQVSLLNRYLSKGIDTPLKIAAKWAPAGDGGNDPERYARFIASKLNIGMNDKIDASVLPALAIAQGQMEGSSRKGYATDGAVIPDATQGENFDDAFAPYMAQQSDVPADAPADTAPTKSPQDVALATLGKTPVDVNGNTLADSQRVLSPIELQKVIESTPDYYGSGKQTGDTSFGGQLKHGKTDAVLSILSGLASAATAPTSNLGFALATGLGAGVDTYQKMRDFENERAKTAQDVALKRGNLNIDQYLAGLSGAELPYRQSVEQSQAGLIGAQTHLTGTQAYTAMALLPAQIQRATAEGNLVKANAFRAQLENLQRQFPIPATGVGYTVDASGNPQPTYSPAIAGAYTGQPGGVPAPAPSGVPTAPTGPGAAGNTPHAPQQGAPATGWAPITTPKTVNRPPAMLMDPASLASLRDQGTHEIGVLANEAKSADNVLGELTTLKQLYANLPEDGFTSPGYGGTERTELVRKLNAYANTFGFQPLTDSSSAEQINKITKQLGFQLARTLSGREGSAVLNQATSANPGLENTKAGAMRVITGLEEDAKRAKDRYAYALNYQKDPRSMGTLYGYDQAFLADNPASNYATRAMVRTVPKADVDALRANPKGARSAIDRKYGAGMSRMILGY